MLLTSQQTFFKNYFIHYKMNKVLNDLLVTSQGLSAKLSTLKSK